MPKQTWKTLAPQLRLVWQLSLPAILTQITTIAMQYIDSAMVGALGADASAAIGLVASSTWLFGGVTAAVSAGFSVQVAHRIGAGEDTEARTVVRHGLAAALTLVALLGLGICRQLPCWLGGGAEICADASAYFLTFSLMLPFSQLNSLTAGFLQCAGDMVTPSVLNAVMCGLDVVCNALLIPHFGVLGAGMGTALACALVSLAMGWCCCVRNAQLRLRRGETHAFRPEILKKAFRIGAPVAVQEIAMNGAMVASTMILAPLGAAAIAANSFAVTAESLCYMPGYGVGSAATTLVGRSVGAGDAAQARRYGNICTALGGALMGCTGLLMMIFCPFVFRLLTPVAEVRTLAAQALRIGLLAEPLFGVSIAAAGALRGAGDTLVPSLLNLGSLWIIRLGLSLLLVGKLGLRGMWIAMAIELCVRGTLMLWRQKTSKFYETQSRLHGG
ncbi:MAG: MATE family efflux transporter [Clostridiales bacterium]|nr:MATE family efflux transporter [Clostridiales bacterium]